MESLWASKFDRCSKKMTVAGLAINFRVRNEDYSCPLLSRIFGKLERDRPFGRGIHNNDCLAVNPAIARIMFPELFPAGSNEGCLLGMTHELVELDSENLQAFLYSFPFKE
ncbi:unnamed protein product [Dovyalis caffra]|uniref:Uncharacterized protein n=1 Tax=Dovyalis caffra TaxID=77055 RepID=A0AAV1SAT4_9ROSI|nr:unnamed protein product [Dovyalis caffra]